MRILFDFLVSFWDITEHAIANWIIVGLMLPITFSITFVITGKVAPSLGFLPSLMRAFHWLLRFVIYVIFVFGLKYLIWLIAQPLIFFNVSEPRNISAIIVAILIFGFAIFVQLISSVKHKLFWF